MDFRYCEFQSLVVPSKKNGFRLINTNKTMHNDISFKKVSQFSNDIIFISAVVVENIWKMKSTFNSSWFMLQIDIGEKHCILNLLAILKLKCFILYLYDNNFDSVTLEHIKHVSWLYTLQ